MHNETILVIDDDSAIGDLEQELQRLAELKENDQ